jgi:hypothetical protein
MQSWRERKEKNLGRALMDVDKNRNILVLEQQGERRSVRVCVGGISFSSLCGVVNE